LPDVPALRGATSWLALQQFAADRGMVIEPATLARGMAAVLVAQASVHPGLCPPEGQVWVDSTSHLFGDLQVGRSASLQGL